MANEESKAALFHTSIGTENRTFDANMALTLGATRPVFMQSGNVATRIDETGTPQNVSVSRQPDGRIALGPRMAESGVPYSGVGYNPNQNYQG